MKNVDLSIWERKTVSQCLLNIWSDLSTNQPLHLMHFILLSTMFMALLFLYLCSPLIPPRSLLKIKQLQCYFSQVSGAASQRSAASEAPLHLSGLHPRQQRQQHLDCHKQVAQTSQEDVQFETGALGSEGRWGNWGFCKRSGRVRTACDFNVFFSVCRILCLLEAQ